MQNTRCDICPQCFYSEMFDTIDILDKFLDPDATSKNVYFIYTITAQYFDMEENRQCIYALCSYSFGICPIQCKAVLYFED